MLIYIWWFLFKKYVSHLFLTYMIRSREIKTLAGRPVHQLLKWRLVGTIHYFYTLFISTFAFPYGNLSKLYPTVHSSHLENKFYLSNLYWQQNLKENLYTYSHLERMGKLNSQSESKVPMTIHFSFLLIFFPFSSILWSGSWKGCIQDNFRVYINLTHQGENNHAISVLHKELWGDIATFLCH